MTVEELCIIALARAGEVTNAFPSTRGLMYRRVGVRQQQLAAAAAHISPDYFGAAAEGVLTGGAADLRDMANPVPIAELITDVLIADKGTSLLATGQRVNIVKVKDSADAALPPRATLRGGVVRQVGTDLAGVVSVKVYYSRLPAALSNSDANTAIELMEPHTELLVVDLTAYLLKRAMGDDEKRQEALKMLADEEKQLLAAWLDHVREYQPAQDRFTPGA